MHTVIFKIRKLSLATAATLLAGCATTGNQPVKGDHPRPFHDEIAIDGVLYPYTTENLSRNRSRLSVWIGADKNYFLDVDCAVPSDKPLISSKFVQFGTGDGTILYQGYPNGGLYSVCLGTTPSLTNTQKTLQDGVASDIARQRAEAKQANNRGVLPIEEKPTITINDVVTPVKISTTKTSTSAVANYGSIQFAGTVICATPQSTASQYQAASLTMTTKFGGNTTVHQATTDASGVVTSFRDGREITNSGAMPLSKPEGVCGSGGTRFKQWFENSVNAALRRLYTPQP